VHRWNTSVIVSLIIGTGVAVAISVLNPASENDHYLYLAICGVVAVCSMILPGLSGSFVLILLGNYELVMIKAVSNFQVNILIPVIIGAAAGLILFSHFLSWIFKKFRDQTISLLTGFILGSLAILWPWKNHVYKLDAAGQILTKSNGEKVIAGYERFIPDSFSNEVILVIIYAIIGIVVIWAIEKYAGTIEEEKA
jgi:putative membrane protein